MKPLRLKTVTAAVMVASGVTLASPAYALIDIDGAFSFGSGTGNGELVLSVGQIDPSFVEISSYTRDLGLVASAFVGGQGPLSILADANLIAFLAGVTPLNSVFYTVTAVYNPPSSEGGFLSSAPTSSPSGAPSFANNQTPHPVLGSYYNQVGALIGDPTPDIAENQSLYLGPGNPSLGSDASYFGTQHSGGGFAGYVTSTPIGADASFFADVFGSNFTGELIDLGGTWNLNATSGTLTWKAGDSPVVPLPGAVWLLGAGFLGYLGLGRRSV